MTELITSTGTEYFKQRAAKAISYLFHPLLMPLISCFLVFNTGGYIVFSVQENYKYVVYAIVFINTILIPSLASVVLLKKGIIRSLHMETIQERRFPFLIATIFFFLTYYFLQKLPLPPIIFLMLLGATLSVLVSLIINLFWKISVHMVGAGGLVGALIGMSIRLSTEIYPIILAAIFCAGIVGYARLKLNAHDHAQVYVGFLVGLTSMFALILGI